MKIPKIFIYPKGENHMTDDIKNALEKDSELNAEEYAKARENASSACEKKTGAVPDDIDEETKHRRIASNFYGTATNFLMAMNDHLLAIRMNSDAQTAYLQAIAEKLGVKFDEEVEKDE